MITYIPAHQSVMFVSSAATNPNVLMLISKAEQSTRPVMIGTSERKVQRLVYSLIRNQEISTVNTGADPFTVSVNDTATNFSDTKPSSTVIILKRTTYLSAYMKIN